MDAIININIDDPNPQSSRYDADFGGDREKGIFSNIVKLIEQYPKIKFTLFVVPNWIDRSNDPFLIRVIKNIFGIKFTNQWNDEPFRIDKHRDWCEWLNYYVNKGNFEIAIHGFEHHKPKSALHSAEFEGLSYIESKKRIIAAESLFKIAGLKYVRGFRPPGWGVSNGLLKALKELKFTFIAFNQSNSRTFEFSKIGGLLNVPQNYSIHENPNEAIRILKLSKNRLFIKGHINSGYGRDDIKNGFDKYHTNLEKVLDLIEREYNLKFKSMSELTSDYLNKKAYIFP